MIDRDLLLHVVDKCSQTPLNLNICEPIDWVEIGVILGEAKAIVQHI